MRRTTQVLLALGLLVLLAQPGRAAEEDAAAIIDRARKAHFPKGLDTKQLASRTKCKGTLHIMGQDLEFTQEVAAQMPNRLRETMELTVKDKKVTVTSVYN